MKSKKRFMNQSISKHAIALLMAIVLVFAGTVILPQTTEQVYGDDEIVVNSIDDLKNLISDTSGHPNPLKVRISGHIFAQDKSLSVPDERIVELNLPSDTSLNIHSLIVFGKLNVHGSGLFSTYSNNGFYINYNGILSLHDSVQLIIIDRNESIRIDGKATLNVAGGKIWASGDHTGSIITLSSGTMNITGGEIQGTITQTGGSITHNGKGTFTVPKNVSKVIFEPNDGTGTMPIQYVANGVPTPLIANAFSYEGHVFTSWNAGMGEFYKDKESVCISTVLILYAWWDEAPVHKTITFDANGGSCDTRTAETITVNDSEVLESLPEASRDAYLFAGWYTGADRETLVTTSTAFSENTTVYAKWEEKEPETNQTIVFKSNGGRGRMKSLEVMYGGEARLPKNTFTRSKSIFNGWNTSKDGSGTFYKDGAKLTGIKEDVTLYAQWTAISLKMSKVKTIKKGKALTLKATLKLNGKAAKGKKVTFLLKGKKYTKKTNAKGVATVTIKKSITKKWKKGKNVTIKATFGNATVKQTAKVK